MAEASSTCQKEHHIYVSPSAPSAIHSLIPQFFQVSVSLVRLINEIGMSLSCLPDVSVRSVLLLAAMTQFEKALPDRISDVMVALPDCIIKYLLQGIDGKAPPPALLTGLDKFQESSIKCYKPYIATALVAYFYNMLRSKSTQKDVGMHLLKQTTFHDVKLSHAEKTIARSCLALIVIVKSDIIKLPPEQAAIVRHIIDFVERVIKKQLFSKEKITLLSDFLSLYEYTVQSDSIESSGMDHLMRSINLFAKFHIFDTLYSIGCDSFDEVGFFGELPPDYSCVPKECEFLHQDITCRLKGYNESLNLESSQDFLNARFLESKQKKLIAVSSILCWFFMKEHVVLQAQLKSIATIKKIVSYRSVICYLEKYLLNICIDSDVVLENINIFQDLTGSCIVLINTLKHELALCEQNFLHGKGVQSKKQFARTTRISLDIYMRMERHELVEAGGVITEITPFYSVGKINGSGQIVYIPHVVNFSFHSMRVQG